MWGRNHFFLFFHSCSDQDRDVKFVVTIAPQTGKVLYEFLENGTTIEVKEFTQNDVNNGRMYLLNNRKSVPVQSTTNFYSNRFAVCTSTPIQWLN